MKLKNTNSYNTGLLQGTAYSRLHTHLSQTLSPHSLSIPEWKVLGQIYETENIKLSQLADQLSYDPPMVTKLAKQLEKKGLVQRVVDSKDERVKTISATSAGKKLILRTEPAVKKTMQRILKGVSQAELLTYIKVLEIIITNTEK